MASKSDFSGHCQACGRLQKLPKERLSKHGYTVDHGYFSGVCRGAGHEPFEVSCKLVETFIQEATAQLTSLEAFQANLRKTNEGPTAWFYVSLANPKGKAYNFNRSWEECTVTMDTVTWNESSSSGSYNKFRRDGDTRWTQKPERNAYGQWETEITPRASEVGSGYNDTLTRVCTEANQVYADWLEHEAETLRRYIKWQEERVRTWKPAPLLPNDAKDKEGFKPTEARY